MRIAEISTVHETTPPRRYGSINRIVSGLTEGLVARGHDVTLFASADSETAAHLIGTFATAPADFYRIDEDWVHVIQSMRSCSDGFDVIHNHNIYGGPALEFLVQPTPMVTTSHTDPNHRFLRHFPDHMYVVLSDSHQRRMEPYRVVRRIYPGLDLADYTMTSDKDDYLLYLGQVRQQKGVVEAIEIAKRCGRDLVIAGPIPPWEAEFFRARVEPRCSSNVRYVGDVGGAERERLLATCFALLAPSQMSETFGLVLIEAMASGTVPIATPVGAYPEVIVDRQTGFLASSLDEYLSCINRVHELDPASLRAYVQTQFSMERMISDYEDLFYELSDKDGTS